MRDYPELDEEDEDEEDEDGEGEDETAPRKKGVVAYCWCLRHTVNGNYVQGEDEGVLPIVG